MQSRFIDIEITIKATALREYLDNWHGFWKDILELLAVVLLCLASASLQNALPSSFPELPLFPALWFIAWLPLRHSPRSSLFWAVMTGFFLDSGSGAPWGMSPLLNIVALTAAQTAYSLLQDRSCYLRFTLPGALATASWTLLRIFPYASGMPLLERLGLIPSQVLLGSFLSACGTALLASLLPDTTFSPVPLPPAEP